MLTGDFTISGRASDEGSGLQKVEILIFPVSQDRLIKPVLVFHPTVVNGQYIVHVSTADLSHGYYLITASALDNEFNVGSADLIRFTLSR